MTPIMPCLTHPSVVQAHARCREHLVYQDTGPPERVDLVASVLRLCRGWEMSGILELTRIWRKSSVLAISRFSTK